MDKGTARIVQARRKGGDVADDANQEAAAIEDEIHRIRSNLDGLVSELDYRRHQLNPLRVVRRHPSAAVALGLLVGAVVLAGVLLNSSRARRRRSWLGKGKRLKAGLITLVEGDDVVIAPNLVRRVVTAAVTASTALAAKRIARHMLRPM